jgi:hypothetical protein
MRVRPVAEPLSDDAPPGCDRRSGFPPGAAAWTTVATGAQDTVVPSAIVTRALLIPAA